MVTATPLGGGAHRALTDGFCQRADGELGAHGGRGGGRNGGGGSRLLWDSLRPVLGDVQKADLAAGAKSPEPWGWAPGPKEPALLAGAPGIGL